MTLKHSTPNRNMVMQLWIFFGVTNWLWSSLTALFFTLGLIIQPSAANQITKVPTITLDYLIKLPNKETLEPLRPWPDGIEDIREYGGPLTPKAEKANVTTALLFWQKDKDGLLIFKNVRPLDSLVIIVITSWGGTMSQIPLILLKQSSIARPLRPTTTEGPRRELIERRPAFRKLTDTLFSPLDLYGIYNFRQSLVYALQVLAWRARPTSLKILSCSVATRNKNGRPVYTPVYNLLIDRLFEELKEIDETFTKEQIKQYIKIPHGKSEAYRAFAIWWQVIGNVAYATSWVGAESISHPVSSQSFSLSSDVPYGLVDNC